MASLQEQLKQLNWRSAFEHNALLRGQDYALQRRASQISASDNLLSGKCRGSGGNVYAQHISLTGNALMGSCSCPVGFNCKHCVAVILQFLEQAPAAQKSSTASNGLSSDLSNWLNSMPKAAEPKDGSAKSNKDCLYYQLSGEALIEIFKVRLRKDGSPGPLKPYDNMLNAGFREPAFMAEIDVQIALLLSRHKRNPYSYGFPNRFELSGRAGGEILALMLQSGRLFLDPEGDPALTLGEPRQAFFSWQPERCGYLRPVWLDEQQQPLECQSSIRPLYYLDRAHNQLGLLQQELPEELAAHLSQAPAIPPESVEAFSHALLQRQPAAPLPKPIIERQLDEVQPQAHLILASQHHTPFNPRTGRITTEWRHAAGLSFLYQGHSAYGKAQPGECLRQRSGQELLSIVRQPKAEQALRKQLQKLGFTPALRQNPALPDQKMEAHELADESAWLHFTQHDLPQLRASGWQIDIEPGFHYDLTPVDEWFANIEEAPGNAWFDLELGILLEGQRISLLPVLLRLLQGSPELLNPEKLQLKADDELLRLPLDVLGQHSGRPLQVMLPFGRLKPVLTLLVELYLREPGSVTERLRLELPDAARLSLLDGSDLHWQGGERLRQFAQKLRELPTSKPAAPAGLQAQLRPYQLQGLAWLQTLRELQVGGILGDDMGLGKTLQTLAHLLTEKHAGRLDRPALVVMPTSLIPNWQDEAARFAPQLRVLALHGPQRHKHFEQIAEHDLLLTTYALLPRDLDRLKALPLHLLVLDEAQYIKNPLSKAAHAARQLDARQRLCLTGTPLENHLGELWSLFHFLMPGWLGDSKRFNQNYRTPIEKRGSSLRLAHLSARIKPFLLRRTKELVASELPTKSEITHWVELNQQQRDLYETVRLAMHRKVREEIQRKGLARSQIIILEALLKLRQVCCDLRLVKQENTKALRGSTSGKLDSLLEMLEELLAEGRRVLLFSQFTSMLALIESELQKRNIGYVQITGATRDRREPVRRFQAGEVPMFLISLKAGGTGLNLTAADTVIHFDPWWNPAVERQATDRAYRIGQDKPVFVYKLIARGTVEEKIQQLQQRKAALAAGLLEGGEAKWQLGEDDLEALFAPLPVEE